MFTAGRRGATVAAAPAKTNIEQIKYLPGLLSALYAALDQLYLNGAGRYSILRSKDLRSSPSGPWRRVTEPEPSHATVSRAIPPAFSQRKRLWVYSSLWLTYVDCPYASLSVQTLGYAERLLLDMEAKLAALARDMERKKERDLLLSECSAHSILWVFGLYEILRTLRESRAPQFAVLEPVFQKLEILRMPLAKHEAKNVKGSTPPPHYPTGCWDVDTGQVGWQVFNPRIGAMEVLSRTPLANEFLSVAAVPPKHMPPFPIGGPLGEFDS